MFSDAPRNGLSRTKDERTTCHFEVCREVGADPWADLGVTDSDFAIVLAAG
jgi:hypothetical protein